MRRTAYNLSIESEIALPELLGEPDPSRPPDLRIRYGLASPLDLADGRQLSPGLRVGPTGLWLRIPGVATFLCRNGDEIVVEPAPAAGADAIRVYLLGSAMAAVLFQRGLFILHGNAVRVGDQCLVCVGPSGAGKSTLAAALMGRGYDVLSDDVVPVDAECRALPGFPRIKLGRDTLDALGIDGADLPRVLPEAGKFQCPVANTQAPVALPIRWIYILGEPGESIQLEPIHGMQRFQPLKSNTYRSRFLEGMTLLPRHLERCAQLASRVRLARLTRPRQGFSPEALADRILEDIARHP